MPDLYLPASPRSKPDEPITIEEHERRERLRDKTAEHMMGLVREAKMAAQAMSEWVEWRGGEEQTCPCPGVHQVQLRMYNGRETGWGGPSSWRWSNSDIIAYRTRARAGTDPNPTA